MDIRTKLVAALVGTALLSMAVFGYLAYQLSADFFLQNSRQQIAAVLASKTREVDSLIEDLRTEVQGLVEDEEGLGPLLAAPEPQDETALAQALARVFAEAARSNRSTLWISLYGAGGALLATTSPDLVPTPPSFDPEGSARLVGLRLLPDGRTAFVFQATLPAGPTGRRTVEVGFSAAAARLVLVDRTGLGETGESMLVAPSWLDQNGQEAEGYLLIGRPDVGPVGSAEFGPLAEAPEVIAQALARQEMQPVEGDFLGTSVTAGAEPLRQPGWRMFVKMDTDEELAPRDELLGRLRTLGFSLAGFGILGGFLLGNALSGRIRRLADTVDRIRHGELELRPEVEGEDEVALLASSLNEFMDQLDRSSDLFQLAGLNVLIVDSDTTNRRMLRDLFMNWRMHPITAPDPQSALEAVTPGGDEEPPQLVILSDGLPGAEAIELADQLGSRCACPIILLSEDPESLDAEALQRSGVRGILPEPVVASDLLEAILEAMGVSASLAAVPDLFLVKTEPRKILLVEDSTIIQGIMSQLLERWGHSVTVVDGGQAGVDAALAEPFDVILMDLEMPEVNGLDATRAIREEEGRRGVRTPIVALTARVTKEDREACMEAGMDAFVGKPVDAKLLFRLVASYPARALQASPRAGSGTEGAAAGTAETEPGGVRTSVVGESAEPQAAPAPSSRAPPSELAPVEDAATDASEDGGLVDWDVASALTGGDRDLLGEIVELFPEESDGYLAAIHVALDASEAERLTRAAHSLKSTIAYFGAPTLVETAQEVEDLARAERFEEARKRIPALEAGVSRLKDALRRGRPADLASASPSRRHESPPPGPRGSAGGASTPPRGSRKASSE